MKFKHIATGRARRQERQADAIAAVAAYRALSPAQRLVLVNTRLEHFGGTATRETARLMALLAEAEASPKS